MQKAISYQLILGFIFGVMGLGARTVIAVAPETDIRVAIISDSALSETSRFQR
jgi:hypothetical protein